MPGNDDRAWPPANTVDRRIRRRYATRHLTACDSRALKGPATFGCRSATRTPDRFAVQPDLTVGRPKETKRKGND